jgi:hypothetical protein
MGEKKPEPIESRPPSLDDLLELCRHLNARSVRYVVIGGMAVIQHGLVRGTEDIDLLVDSGSENEMALLESLSYLPDHAVGEIRPGELDKFKVIRVADEIVVDLMTEACGVAFSDVQGMILSVKIRNVVIPFAGLELMLKLKQGNREKDIIDREFIQAQLGKKREMK